ncbi:hypothetical protein Gpo141_00010259 [Globisporangium polare]
MISIRACSIAIFSYILLLLPCCHAEPHQQRTDSLAPEGVELPHDALLVGLLDAERSAVERQLELYRRKVTLLKALLARYDEDDELAGDDGTAKDSAAPATSDQPAQSRRAAQFQQSRQRQYRQQQQHSATQRFSDWFDLQGSYYPPVVSSPLHKTESNRPGEPGIRLDLLSFRPNANPNAKKSHNAQRGGRRTGSNHLHAQADSTSSPLLQFLAVFETKQGRLDLHHPITNELVWQHELFMELRSSAPTSSPITDYFFTSERLSYLATVRANGEVSFYKLRVLHNRRLLSGDHRILSKFDRPMCMKSSINQKLQKKNLKTAMGMPLSLPWRSPEPVNTLPAANHPHIDFELLFSTKSDANSSVRTEKVAVVTFFSHSYVITANSKAELAFFHGENGTFISSLATDWFTQDAGASGITQFHVLATGIVAAAVGNRIHFVNPLEQTLVNGGGVTCDGGASEEITSVDSDPWRYSTIYAATSSGRVLVFRLLNFERPRKGGSSGRHPMKKLDENGNLVFDEESESACVLVDQLLPKSKLPALSQEAQTQAKHQTAVRAIPGYVIMTTNDAIVLFQSSYEGLPTYVTAHSIHSKLSPPLSQNSLSNTRTEQLIALSAARDPNAHPVALAVHVLESGGSVNETTSVATTRARVDVYESLLPQPTSSLDLGWLRVPIMLLCAVAVMYWQQLNNNNNENNMASQMDLGAFGAAAGGQRGKSSGADFDVSRFSKMAAAGRTYPKHHCV